MKGGFSYWVGLWMVVLLAVACKPSLPEGVVSEKEMENLLYDYHLSQGMAGENGERGVYQRIYLDAVLRKHGLSESDFNKSLLYYMRHAAILRQIYARLDDRFKAEANALGMSASDMSAYGSLSSTGDTASIWKEGRSQVLTRAVPFNHYSFSIKADTAYHAGDRIILNFDCNFIYQDGMRNGCAMLAVVFKNDSVASSYVMLTAANHYSITVEDRNRLGIKQVKGYFMLANSQSNMESATTLQLMFLNNIQMVRMHVKKIDTPHEPKDSAKVQEHIKEEVRPLPPSSGQLLPPPRRGAPLRPALSPANAQRIIK